MPGSNRVPTASALVRGSCRCATDSTPPPARYSCAARMAAAMDGPPASRHSRAARATGTFTEALGTNGALTCKLALATIDAIRANGPGATDSSRGRMRADWKGNNGIDYQTGATVSGKTTFGRDGSPGAVCGAGGSRPVHCNMVEHCFSSGGCHLDMTQDAVGACDCTYGPVGAGSDVIGRDPFTSSCSSWGHGGMKGFQCGFSDGHDGAGWHYGNGRWVVSGTHIEDTQTDKIDWRLWVR